MRLLDRYVLSEMVLPFITGIAAVVMMLIGNTLFQLVDVILRNHIPVSLVAREVVFNIPSLLVLTMPVGVALASSLSVNRLARDSEITAIRMSGTPLMRIFRPIFLIGLIASVASFLISERVVPWAVQEKAKTEQAMFGYALAYQPSLAANKVFAYQNYEFYVGNAIKYPKLGKDALQLDRVVIFENPRSPYGYPVLITAGSATFNDGLWSMSDVVVHTFGNAGFTRTEAHSATASLDLHNPLPVLTDSGASDTTPDSYTMSELGQRIRTLTLSHLDSRDLQVAYYFKLSMPFLCLGFAIFAPPISLLFSRTGTFFGIFLSIMMVFFAWNTLLFTKALGIHGYMPPLAAAWIPDIICGAAGLWMLWKAE